MALCAGIADAGGGPKKADVEDMPLNATSPAVLAKTLDRLSALARKQGTVRVLVGVRVPFIPEGALAESAARSQRAAIAKAQSAVLAAVPIQARDSIVRYQSIPFHSLPLRPPLGNWID